MPFSYLLCGLIWSGFIGLAIGNFATNPIYRLPRNASLFAKDPYCDACNAPLGPRDLFPVLSWLMTRGRCRYCGASVPGAYTVTEALIGILFVVCYLQYGFTEPFLLIALGATALIMIGMMLTLDDFFSDRTLIAAITCGMLYRTLQDHTLYGFAGTAYAALLAGAGFWRLFGRPMKRDAAAFPGYFKLLTAAGIWLNFPELFVTALAALLAIPLLKRRPHAVEWTIVGAIIGIRLLQHA